MRPLSTYSMLSPQQDGFHSPIVRGPMNHIDKIDNLKFLMMPEISPKRTFESEEQSRSILLQNEFETKSTSMSDTYMRKNENHDQNPTLHSVSFDETQTFGHSSNMKGNFTIVDDIISGFEDRDITLMQEALSVLINNVEEKCSNDDQCYRRDECTAINNQSTRNSLDFTPFPIRSYKKKNPHNIETNHLLAAEQGNNSIDNVEKEIGMELHPLILPQVTFDEGEEFNSRNFFEQQETLHYSSKVVSHDVTQSEQPSSKPSKWLLQRLTSDTLKFQKHMSNTCRTSVSQNSNTGNAERVVKRESIRASKETKHKHWSGEEDEMLRLAMTIEQSKPIDWIDIARKYFDNLRSATQCRNRWKNYLKPGVVRGKWQEHEDDFIVAMVGLGLKWVDIANGLPGRTGEHVRERYVNFLDRNLKKTCWTAEEDRILFENQRILGNKWSEIRKLLPGRSDNSIKNRFHNRRNAQLRRLKRESLEKERWPL